MVYPFCFAFYKSCRLSSIFLITINTIFMMKKYLLLFGFLMLMSAVFSQKKTITGVITSSEDDLGLPGVTIVVKGTSRGTITDVNGNYSISAKSTDVLVYTFVGFNPEEIQVGTQKVINLVMTPAAQQLDEFVVTALGVKRQKREIGYSTERVEAEAIVKSSEANIISGIAGRSAGVQVSSGDGVEGGSTRIVIRGNNNINSMNQPLFVVDGVPMENIPGLTDIGRGADWGNALNNINAFDIESYNILKGGAASALYGSKGANGVIEITTKRGMKRKGLGVTYNYSYKKITPYRYREVQNKYGHGGPISLTAPTFPTNETGDTLLYPGIYETSNLVLNAEGETVSSTDEFGAYGGGVSWGPEMNGEMVKWWDGVMRPYSPQPDNIKIPFKNGFTQTHNVAISGGNEKGTMRVSFTKMNHSPIIENSNLDQVTINFAANLKVSKRINLDIAFSYIDYHRLNSPMIGESASSFSKGHLYSWGRSYKGLDYENYALSSGAINPQEGYPFKYVSPSLWWTYFNNNTTLSRDKYLGSITLNYNITDWLTFMGRFGRDYTLSQYESRNKPTDVVGLEGGYYSNSMQRNISNNMDVLLTAAKSKIFDSEFDLSLSVGGSSWEQDYYSIGGNSGRWYYPNMYTFFNFTNQTLNPDGTIDVPGSYAGVNEGILRRKTNSVYSFFNVGYADYLFLDITGRNDWSSTLPVGNNSYFYPSASLSFIASEAFNFEDRLPWVNFMKIRGAIAQTATDDAPYQTEFYYNTGFYGGDQSSSFPGTIPAINLKPQRVNSYEGGFILGLLDNKIELDFTYYYLYSFDQIIVAPLPSSSGAESVKINEGVLTNRGFEIILNTVPVHTKDLTIRTGLNFSRNRNKVESLGEYADEFTLADIWGLNGPAIILHEGEEYGTISGYDYVYHENGQPILNDEGTHYKITDTRVPIGNASPDFLAGWHTNVSYKGFQLSTLIDTKWGGDIYCGSYVVGLQTGQSPETLIERDGGGLPYTDPDGNVRNIGVILPGVYEDGTPNDKVVHYYYKYLPNAGGWGHVLSTPGIIENTWIKLREVSLSYTVPQSIVDKSKVFKNLRLSFTGRNLAYLYTTLPDKINPEGIMGAGNAQGFEWASFPSTRSFVFGISANF